ncbi:MAG: hypothetical protein AB4062_12135, partial [Crocosphaera sp.]
DVYIRPPLDRAWFPRHIQWTAFHLVGRGGLELFFSVTKLFVIPSVRKCYFYQLNYLVIADT